MTTRVEIVNDFLAINVKPGSTIQDVVEASGSALPFGCRDGQCGTCLVTIEQGMEFISDLNEKEKKVIEENKTYDMKLIEVNENSKEDDCIEIEKISIKNSTIFDEDDFEELIKPYLNNCNGMKNLSNLRDKISNMYIDKGYVTSRAYFKPQDLSDAEMKNKVIYFMSIDKVFDYINISII